MSIFGDLFAEGNSGAGSSSPDGDPGPGGSGANGPVPLAPRLPSNFCGIFNQGATCYLNSLLQTLFMTPDFRAAIFSLGSQELGRLSEKETSGSKVRVIPIQLQRLFARLLLLDAQGTNTTELTDSFGWTNSEEMQQHDVQELNRILFCAIEDSLVGTSGQNLIRNLYQGVIVNQTKCETCGRISEREEDFRDLCLTVAGMSGLADALSFSYLETERLCGNNQYRCDNCDKLVDAVKGARIRSLPKILTMSLLRFSFNMKTFERYKETGKFVFPTEIDMAPFCEYLGGVCTEYELYSVVIHSGSTHGGHYRAYIRDIDSIGFWSHSDSIVIPKDPKTGEVDFIQLDSPLELVHAILGKVESMNIDKLCGEITKETGVSWNKRFKRNYGPITKFICKYDDQFTFDPTTNKVSLKTTRLIKSERAPEQNSGQNSERSFSPCPEPGKCWFNFDDSRVFPVKETDLEKQFCGKESAYMLFYRSKDLTQTANENPSQAVPLWLLEEVQEANISLEKQRVEYELAINTTHLQIHYAGLYTYRHGNLCPKDESCSFLPLTIDLRKSLGELRAEIRELGGELMTSSEFDLHIARLTPGGFHLFEVISGHDLDPISTSPVTFNSKIFVWDGKQVEGHAIEAGSASQPISLQLTLVDGSILQHVFGKNISIRELRSSLEVICGIPRESIQLFRVSCKGDESVVNEMRSELDDRSLTDLGVESGEHWIVDDCRCSESDLPSTSLAEKANIIAVMVHNRCGDQWSRFPVHVEKIASVAELKAVILSQVSFHSEVVECRLRVEDDSLGLQPPLHEDLSLVSCGVSQGSLVVLELGQAPRSSEVTLKFSCSDLDESVEVIIDIGATVSACLTVAINRLQLQGDDWHVRKTNWCGEAGTILDDLDMTLSQSAVGDGDTLLLQKGKLPPKGHVNLQLFLYPSTDSSLTEDIKNLSIHRSSEVTPLGDLIIAKSARLDDLKGQIMSLPALAQVLTLGHLRVRLMEANRLSSVLRNTGQTLQRMKLVSGTKIAVQVLSQEENLNVNQIVLSVRLKVIGQKAYLPAQEFIWDDSKGLSPSALRHRMAEWTGLSVASIGMAKHFPAKHDWLVIQESAVKTSKSSKAKKKGNLKHAPFHLADGDTIGIKDLSLEKGCLASDFCTEEDEVGKKKMEKEAEEKRKTREEQRRHLASMDGIGGATKCSRPEVGIKIHVADFTS